MESTAGVETSSGISYQDYQGAPIPVSRGECELCGVEKGVSGVDYIVGKDTEETKVFTNTKP